MRKTFKRSLAVLLTLLMFFQLSEGSVVFAADALDRALHPEKRIELVVPQSLQDGNHYFFIREAFVCHDKSLNNLSQHNTWVRNTNTSTLFNTWYGIQFALFDGFFHAL